MNDQTNSPSQKKLARLFVLSGPSGVGKTVLCNRIIPFFSTKLVYSISSTSRKPRENEIHGRDYFFYSKEDFESAIKQNQFAEWALVHGNYYGTPKSFLNEKIEQGINVLLNIDVQGAAKIFAEYLDAVTIFILPPSLEVLKERLKRRNLDSEKDLLVRLSNAKMELEQQNKYHHILVNDDLEKAVVELKSIFEKYI
ncbi:MAG: guanylate kinase [Candidatus Riflebacteria bacterium]|nr:guanylate kinase [Candidatus Riflebacteria bacterium]